MILYLKHQIAMISQKKIVIANSNKIIYQIINTTEDSLTVQIFSQKQHR